MTNKLEIGLVGLVLLVVVFVLGLIIGANSTKNTASNHTKETITHTHEGREVAEPYPTLEMKIVPDPKSGWNLHLETTNFIFAPEQVNTEHQAGIGHAHLYINGQRIKRLYGHWYHLTDLPPGQHQVTVNLSGNDHTDLLLNGEMIQATETIIVPE